MTGLYPVSTFPYRSALAVFVLASLGVCAVLGAQLAMIDPTAEDADACVLLTKTEAEAALEEKMQDTKSGPLTMRGGVVCLYASAIPVSARSASVRIEPPGFDWSRYKEEKRIEGERMAPKRGYIRPIPDLGQDAYFARHTLFVRTNKVTLAIHVWKTVKGATAPEESDTPEEAIELQIARRALLRLR